MRSVYCVRPPVLVLIAAGVLCSTMLGGCPAPQTPSQPSLEPNQTSPGTTTPTTTTPGGDRPVTLPVPDEQQGGATGPTGPTGATGATGPTGGGSTFIYLRVSEPYSAAVLRPGTTVSVSFYLSLGAGTNLDRAELVIARDDDRDGVADGDPVITRVISATAGTNTTSFDTQELVTQGLLGATGLGSFVFGARVGATDGTEVIRYGTGTITVDAVLPTATWVSPVLDALVGRDGQWAVQITTDDNSSVTLTILLDPDLDPESGNEVEFTREQVAAGAVATTVTKSLSSFPVGTYYYYYSVTDGYPPAALGYAQDPNGTYVRLGLTDRLIADPNTPFNVGKLDPYDPNTFDNSGSVSKGAILHGFNFNDLAGSSMAKVPDLNGDGVDELMVVSRFGKPYNVSASGVGFGEAYLIYGTSSRLRGKLALNAVGSALLPGLTMPGIRTPLSNVTWTHGISDVTIIPDMDGDGLAELVFSFPRVESVSIGNDSSTIQSVMPDVGGMGSLEYDAYYGSPPSWHTNEAQFTRGGIVIVSSSSRMLRDPTRLNRKGDRVLDLAEVGQMFTSMGPASYVRYVRETEFQTDSTDCGGQPTKYEDWTVKWDVVLANQGPGGFDNHFTNLVFADPNSSPPAYAPNAYQPPLANIRQVYLLLPDDVNDPCNLQGGGNCVVTNEWYVWAKCALGQTFPGAIVCDFNSWHTGLSQLAVWTGFYGASTVEVSPLLDNEVGARILGQRREDRFGTTVGADGTWLYISAPLRTAGPADVLELPADRAECGVVYQLRTDARPFGVPYTRTQLWIEPNAPGYPYPDAELPLWPDFTMAVPHQYIIKTVGSTRGLDYCWSGAGGECDENNPRLVSYGVQSSGCLSEYTAVGGVPANAYYGYDLISAGVSRYYVERAWQIVGPHAQAHLSYVRGLGDVNGDGIRDFAVGSKDILQNFSNPGSAIVGGVFIVFGRPPGLEGNYLLDRLALDPSNLNRLAGVYLRGSDPNQALGRVFDDAGDFNGDGRADVIVGGEGANSGAGEAIVLLGSPTLESPAGGWTIADAVAAGRAVHFTGVSAGDRAGTNVAGAGDVDGDGVGDILIAAPGAFGGRGAVYLIYGSSSYVGKAFSLNQVGTLDLPGAVFVGRNAGDQLGGGRIRFPTDRPVNLSPDPNAPVLTVDSRGVIGLGDIDGDGRGDYAISSMLADVSGRTDCGEVYILYGRGDPR